MNAQDAGTSRTRCDAPASSEHRHLDNEYEFTWRSSRSRPIYRPHRLSTVVDRSVDRSPPGKLSSYNLSIIGLWSSSQPDFAGYIGRVASLCSSDPTMITSWSRICRPLSSWLGC
ncbi:hypothetical protein ACI65C_005429 [Semiaphis heraclei]